MIERKIGYVTCTTSRSCYVIISINTCHRVRSWPKPSVVATITRPASPIIFNIMRNISATTGAKRIIARNGVRVECFTHGRIPRPQENSPTHVLKYGVIVIPMTGARCLNPKSEQSASWRTQDIGVTGIFISRIPIVSINVVIGNRSIGGSSGPCNVDLPTRDTIGMLIHCVLNDIVYDILPSSLVQLNSRHARVGDVVAPNASGVTSNYNGEPTTDRLLCCS